MKKELERLLTMMATSSTIVDSELTWLRRSKRLRISSEGGQESLERNLSLVKEKLLLRNALGEEEVEVETDRETEIMMIRISEEGIEIEIFLEIEEEVEEEKERVIKIEKEIGNKIGDGREEEKIIEEGKIKEKAQRGREESLSQVVVQAALLPLIVGAAVQALSQVVLKLMAKMLNERDYLIT